MSGHDALRKALPEACQWYVRLQAGDVAESEHAAWQFWLNQAESHRHAWQQVEILQAQLHQLPTHLVAPTLKAAARTRRQLLRQLGTVVLAAPLGFVAWRLAPWQHAQYATSVGEQRRVSLPDGGQLMLNTASAADIGFDQHARRIRLYRGEILVETAADPQSPARPFFVDTPHGRIQALGTRFTVKVGEGHSHVAVLEKTVRIFPAASVEVFDLQQGQEIRFSEKQTESPSSSFMNAWWTGSLSVVDMPLRELLNELSRYRKGSLNCADDIAAIKISGAFPLDNIDRALAAITRVFPVQEQRLTPWWIRLVPLDNSPRH